MWICVREGLVCEGILIKPDRASAVVAKNNSHCHRQCSSRPRTLSMFWFPLTEETPEIHQQEVQPHAAGERAVDADAARVWEPRVPQRLGVCVPFLAMLAAWLERPLCC